MEHCYRREGSHAVARMESDAPLDADWSANYGEKVMLWWAGAVMLYVLRKFVRCLIDLRVCSFGVTVDGKQ